MRCLILHIIRIISETQYSFTFGEIVFIQEGSRVIPKCSVYKCLIVSLTAASKPAVRPTCSLTHPFWVKAALFDTCHMYVMRIIQLINQMIKILILIFADMRIASNLVLHTFDTFSNFIPIDGFRTWTWG